MEHDRHSGRMQSWAYEVLANTWYFGQRARIWDQLVAVSGAQPGEEVLDIGCGTGYFARRIAPVIGPAGRMVGIDPSPAALDYAAAHSPPNCIFQVAHAEKLPFIDASFDMVVSSLTFHHIETDHRCDAVQEMFRVLRPGGRLCIADIRPPRTHFLERIISAAHGQAKVHNIFDHLKAMTIEAGFTVSGTGNVSRLCYVTAERPRDRSPE